MPLRFIAIFLLTITCTFLYTPKLSGEILIESSYRDSNSKHDMDQQAFADMVQSFELYESFLHDVYQLQDYRIPIHGESSQAAITYLSEGFSEELAQDIVAAYLQWNSELQKMVLIPCDGIPTISSADINLVSISRPNDKDIVFQRTYEDCYIKGDRYLFSVTLKQFPAAWKIEAIGLEELK